MSVRRIIGVLQDDYPNLKVVQVTGVVNADAQRFEVNFRNVKEEYLFHFNVRLNENCVVRNSTRDGQQWQKEERDGGMPFHQGKPFSIEFELNKSQSMIEIRVDSQPFVSFHLRDNIGELSAIEVFGDAHDVEVKMSPPKLHPKEEIMPVPSAGALLPSPTTQGGEFHFTGGRLGVPFKASLTGFLQTHRLRIVGTPLPNANHFTVNLLNSETGDILFHYKPRFDQNCVVRNSRKAEHFQNEERDGDGCPFVADKSFSLDFHLHGEVIRVGVHPLFHKA